MAQVRCDALAGPSDRRPGQMPDLATGPVTGLPAWADPPVTPDVSECALRAYATRTGQRPRVDADCLTCIPIRSRPAPAASLPASAGCTSPPATGSSHLCAVSGAAFPPGSSTGSAFCTCAADGAVVSLLTSTSAKAGVLSTRGKHHSHLTESRRRPLHPLIKYGARGSYVVIYPWQGELPLVPDSPQGVCLARFVVVLPVSGQVWPLHCLSRLPQRSDSSLPSSSGYPSAPRQTVSGAD